MTTALILTTYNRPDYLRRCLESLSRAVPPDVLIIVDDASTDEATRDMIGRFDHGQTILIKKASNKGIKDSLLQGFNIAFSLGADLAINLDADAIVKPDFIKKLTDLHNKYEGRHIVSGFNCDNPKNPVLREEPGAVARMHCNGINMCMNREQYTSIVRPALLSNTNWDFAATHSQPFVISKPSVVQHIGLESSMGHVGADVACDFVQLSLPTVTLLGIDAHDPAGLRRAAEICQRDTEFGAVQIITERLFTGREAYSHWCITEMAKYVQTEHVLIIHPDGYIQNVNAWDDDWLQWDYIGACWDWYNEHQNGNGGFSLRSKKLLDILSKLDDTIGLQFHPEDDFICRQIRPWLEQEHGIRFAPVEVCKKFSVEGYGLKPEFNIYAGEFGFHGKTVRGLPEPLRKIEPPVKNRATARRR